MRLTLFCAILVAGLPSCAQQVVSENATPKGYKYYTITRDSAGHYRAGRPYAAGDSAVFVYDIDPRDFDAISHDRVQAAHRFIESRKAAPPECVNGFKVVRLGRLENGAVVVSIECT